MKKKHKDLHWSLRHKEYIAPVQQRFSRTFATSASFQGTTPSVFVGKYGYPKVHAGFLSTPQYEDNDRVDLFKEQALSIPQIIARRVGLVHGAQPQQITDPTALTEKMQAVALNERPSESEINLASVPKFKLHAQAQAQPHGPSGQLKDITLTTEQKMHRKVERAHFDTDMLAKDALISLNETKSEHFLAQALSSGAFGQKRKLVPTRWSITAVDDQLSQNDLANIKTYDAGPVAAYAGNYLGNHCIVLALGSEWSYELFEMHESSSTYTTDYEGLEPRKTYATQCTGGYYAARLAITEHCQKSKQQNQFLVLRIITDAYEAPLGVWVFREAMRNAMQATPIIFHDKQLLLTYAQKWAQKKFGYDVAPQLKASNILHKPSQQSLSEFQ